MSGNLQLFWKLASSSKQDRLSASDQLVSDLLEQQAALASSSKVTIESSEGDEQLDAATSDDPLLVSDEAAQLAEEAIGSRNAADLAYSLKRLIRGLASPRENSRLGFAVALTELLSKLDSVTSQEVLALILKYATPQGSASGQEQRDLLFAKLFGVLALVQSDLLFGPTSSLAHFQRTMEVLFALTGKKAWLGESCGWVLFQTIDRLCGSGAPTWGDDALSWLARTVSAMSENTPEKVAILFRLGQIGRLNEKDTVLTPPFKSSALLSPANLPVLARVMRDATTSEATEAGVSARPGFRPQLHFAWDVLLDAFLDPASSAQPPSVTLPEFFRVVVDDSLFAASSSTERKSWGFQVFERALSRASDQDKPLLFTPNFMRTWINQLAGQDRFLHKAALKTASTVQEVVSGNPKVGFSIVSQLIGEHGNQNFDTITKTKTVSGVLSALDTNGVREYTNHLRDLIYKASGDKTEEGAKGIAAQRKWALDQLLIIIRTVSIPKDDACVQAILELLIAHGYFAMKQPLKKSSLLTVVPEVELNDEYRQLCRSRLLSCLSELSSQTTVLSDSDGKTRKAQGINSEGELWLALAYDTMLRFDKDTKTFASIFDRDDEIEARLKQGRACLDKIRKKENAAKDAGLKDQLRAFRVLLLAGLIVSVDAEDGAADLVEPLCDCADTLFFATAGSKAKKTTVPDGETEAEGIEVLVDCLVNFLELPSAFLRFVATHAFEPFAKDMTANSLDHLFSQIGLGQAAEGSVNGAASAEEVDGDAPEGAEGAEESDTSATSEDDEDEDMASADDDDDEDAAGDVDPELRAKIQAVLREGGLADRDDDEDADVDDADDGASDSSVELSDLDDDQMLMLDDKLAEVFRQQLATKSSKASKKEAKQEESIFKNKILDLLEIYARKQSGDQLALRLISPLFNLARDEEADEKQLSNRAGTILRARICKAKDYPEGISAADVVEELEETHAVIRAMAKSQVTELAAAIIHYLTKITLGKRTISAERDAALLKTYKETLTDFLTRRKSHVKPLFLVESFKRFPQIGWALREDILDSCRPGAAHAFRQLNAMNMLEKTLTQKSQSTDKDEILGFVPQISSWFGEVVSSASTDATSPYSAGRLKDALKFVSHVARLSKRLAPSDDKLRAAWKPAKLREATDQLQTSERFKASSSLNALVKQLFAILEGTQAGGKKAGKASPAAAAKGNNKKGKANKADSATSTPSKKRSADEQAEDVAASPAAGSQPPSAKKAKAKKAK